MRLGPHKFRGMKIAFYAPLKPIDHPVPSGDRLMARLLKSAMEHAGHEVTIISNLRVYLKEPSNAHYSAICAQAAAERERIAAEWRHAGTPDLVFTYHPYYKSPDLIGAELARTFALPYVIAEASYSSRRNIGVWEQAQQEVLRAVRQARVTICFTGRDRDGLRSVLPSAPLEMLPPFLDSSGLKLLEPDPQPQRLVTVAMMREGNKLESYQMLAEALKRLTDIPWTLDIAGDGPRRAEVEAAFSGFPPGRVRMHGLKQPDEIARIFSQGSVFVWPGCREAYGLSYLEAQAAGLPVIGQAEAGVPEVVEDGRTGILTQSGDIGAYASAIRHLLADEEERRRMAGAARYFAREERSFATASSRLAGILNRYVGID